jgi:hypothetical protein
MNIEKLKSGVCRGIKKQIKHNQRAVRHNVRQYLKTISREESK